MRAQQGVNLATHLAPADDRSDLIHDSRDQIYITVTRVAYVVYAIKMGWI